MQMPEKLITRWTRQSRVASRYLTIDERGILLGKTLLAPFKDGALEWANEPLHALLCVAYGREISSTVLESFHHAGRCYKRGDKALAQMHLALTGLHAIDIDQAQRLFVAHWAMENGVTPQQLLKFAGIGKYNPNHLGPGPGGGQFTTASRNGDSNGLPAGSRHPESIAPSDTKGQTTDVAADEGMQDDPSRGVSEYDALPPWERIAPQLMLPTLPEGLMGEGAATGTVAVTEENTLTSAQVEENLQNLLMPGGQRVGQAGTRGVIREVQGNAGDAQTFFNELTQSGEILPDSNYPAIRKSFPNGGTISIRTFSTTSPDTAATIDSSMPNIPIEKIKFNP